MNRLPLGTLVLGLFSALAHSQSAVPVGCVSQMAPRELQDFSGVDMAAETLPGRDYAEVLRACQSRPLRLLPGAAHPMARRPPMPPAATVPTPQPKPVASNWLETDRRIHADLLAATGADILVVPLQTQGYGFDRIERSLLTADLAYALGAKVADPFIVSRALGEGRRRFTDREILDLAKRIKAKTVVVGYVGHLDRRELNLTLQTWRLTSDLERIEQRQQKDWRGIPFTHEAMPYSVLHGRLPAIVSELGIKVTSAAPPPDKIANFPKELSVTPRDLVNGAAKSVPASSALLLLAGLAPFDGERTRERMFERVLVASMNLDADHARRRFTQAFALMQLSRRPAALELLKNDRQPAAQTLRELLNGNLPEAKASWAAVSSRFERLLLRAAILDLSHYYGREDAIDPADAMQLFATSPEAWLPLVALRLKDLDNWQVPAAVDIKGLLDQIFPVGGLDVASIVTGNAVVRDGEYDEVSIDVGTARHLRRAIEQAIPTGTLSPRPNNLDLLWLLEGTAESRLIKTLEMTAQMQGRPRDAAGMLDKYRPFFDGHPELVDFESSNAQAIARQSTDDEAASWRRKAREGALFQIEYGQGPSRSTWSAFSGSDDGPEVTIARDVFGYDFPRRGYWLQSFGFGPMMGDREPTRSLLLEALAFNQQYVNSFTQLRSSLSPADQASAAALMTGRFNGAPGRPRDAAVSAAANVTDPIEGLRAAVSADPADWRNYLELGQQLIRQRGAYEEAAKIFLSYPGFDLEASGNAVGRSNNSYEAGSELFWQGRPELAKPLYEFSAALGTGSEGSMTSALRLELLKGNFAAVAEGSLQRANRYPNAYAYRDYLSLLHAMDYGKEAWLGFSQVAAQFELPQVWVAALVGHRKDGLDAAGLKKWLMQPEIRNAKFRTRQFAPAYALTWATADAMPPEDLGQLIDAVEGTTLAKVDSDGVSVLRPHPMGTGLESLRPTPLPGLTIKRLPPGTPVRSSLTLFADGYAQLRRGNHAGALEKFRAYAERYPIDGFSSDGFSLAYIAAASARTGDPLGLEKFLNDRKPQRVDFDGWLARAFFHAHRKEVDAAEAALKRAFQVRPHTDYRPILTEYQFAEACEWIYQETGDARFKAMLLDWAKRHQQIQPTHAWAYAMQYSYETDAAARDRALAMTLYLDPKSHRIAKAKPADLGKAKAWLKDNNPFKQVEHEQVQASTMTGQ